MGKLDRVVEVYKSRYAMHLKDFFRFMYEKVEAPFGTLRQVERRILEEKLKISEQEIRHYLALISAAQQGVAFDQLNQASVAACSNIKFCRKPKQIDQNALEFCRASQGEEKQLCSKISLEDYFLQQLSSKDEERQKEEKHFEPFQMLSQTEIENEAPYKIDRKSSLFQNQSSVQLLCEDHSLHFFEGKVLHAAKELKKSLIEAVEKKSGREIQATKFVCEFSPKVEATLDFQANLCFLARSSNDLCIAVIMNAQGENAEQALVMCLDSKRELKCRKAKQGQQRAGYFSFEELDLRCDMRDGALAIDAKVKRNKAATSNALEQILQAKSLHSLPALRTYQYFQVVFK